MSAYGMPGIGGSLGRCCYCGDTFLGEIVFGTTCRGINVGGQEMFVHIKHKGGLPSRDCFSKLIALTDGGGTLKAERWLDLPDDSPLKAPMKKIAEQQ